MGYNTNVWQQRASVYIMDAFNDPFCVTVVMPSCVTPSLLTIPYLKKAKGSVYWLVAGKAVLTKEKYLYSVCDRGATLMVQVVRGSVQILSHTASNIRGAWDLLQS